MRGCVETAKGGVVADVDLIALQIRIPSRKHRIFFDEFRRAVTDSIRTDNDKKIDKPTIMSRYANHQISMKIEKFQRKLNETSTEPCLQIYSAGIVQLFLALTVSNGDKRAEKINQVEWWKIPPKNLDCIANSVAGDIRTLHLGADPAPKEEEATQGALLQRYL